MNGSESMDVVVIGAAVPTQNPVAASWVRQGE